MRVTKDPATRRGDILNAALELFREEGFEKVSVETIAQKAGIAKGSFYNYFKTKECAYEAVITDIALKHLHTTTELLADRAVGPKQRLERYIEWTFQLDAQQEKSLSRILAPQANTSQQQMYIRAFDAGVTQMTPMFESLLKEGAELGEFTLANPRFTAVVMLGAFRGIHMAFYNGLDIDLKTGKVYLYDFLTRLLGTTFEAPV